MDLSNRTVFIVGGTSGIGRELARRFAAAGSTVAVGGRSAEALLELSHEGIGTFGIDVTDGASVAHARDAVLVRYPELDTVVTMPGVMLLEDLRDPAHFEAAQTTIGTNLVGTIRVVDAFTPHLVQRGAGTTIPWLFAGLNPARPIQSQYIYLKLRRLGLGGLAGRNTARLAMAADVPASILAALTGTSIDNATDWTNFAKRDWTGYISSRRSDS
ncbi:SDR family NAD(P)-dependent oxidoreductase [Streptomyces sp. NPDC005780]|uniref:SDR family NAD(P)-dependent oxidoreductase n=1 Tax=Streptomyces sp. NPDC005780 TaxID=3364730 RepID=UPI0036B21A2C